MEKQTPSYYSILTADVRYNKNLTYFEKILYSEITALSNINGYSNASNRYFANLYQNTVSTISLSIRHLKEQGFLKVVITRDENKMVKSRKLYPLTHGSIQEDSNTPIKENLKGGYTKKTKEGYTKKSKEGIQKNLISNITSINTTSNNNMSEISKKQKSDVPDENKKAAKYLWGKIKTNNPKAKEPKFDKWANDIRLMHERDKRSYTDIKNIIDWSMANDFWSAVILSPAKLRKQYDQLNMQLKRDLKKKKSNDRPMLYDNHLF